jgi:single-strand DNA-binding protein
MARSLNRAEIIGNVGVEPELRTTPQGNSVCTLKIATSESYKDKNTNEWKDDTEWHRVVFWDNLAEQAAKNLNVGSKIYVEGKIRTRKYDDREGITRFITEIVASKLIILDPKTQKSNYSDNTSQLDSSQNIKSTDSSSLEDDFSNTETEDDDDIPF